MTKKEIFFIAIIVILGLSGSAIYNEMKDGVNFFNFDMDMDFRGPSHSFTAEEVFEVAGESTLNIENKFGYISIVPGMEGTVKLKLEKEIFMKEEAKAKTFSEKITAQFSSAENGYHLGTNRALLSEEKVDFKTNMILEVPASSTIFVENKHGDVTVKDITGDIEMATAFSDLKILNPVTAVKINNRHGDVEITDSANGLTISNEHGDVRLNNINGDVELTAQHCDIIAENIEGTANIETSHGEVSVISLKKDATIDAPHCRVTAENIEGFLTIINSHDDVELSNIMNGVKISSKHGDINISDIDGGAEVNTSYDGITIYNLKGKCNIRAEHCGVDVTGYFDGGTIETSHKSVSIDELAGSLNITNRQGDVFIRTMLKGDNLTISNEHGDIEVGLTDPDKYTVKADSTYGEIVCPDENYNSEKQDNAVTVKGGSGPSTIDLSATHGSIKIEEVKASI